MPIPRVHTACMLTPEDVTPSDERLEVIGVFNPGAVRMGDEVVLLVRVAEQVREHREGWLPVPSWARETALDITWLAAAEYDCSDPRIVRHKETGISRLTFLSHFLVARSTDGRRIDSVDPVRLLPDGPHEEFGIEDARITPLDGAYCITYVAVSRHGVATCLATTRDFRTFERHGVLFPPENKDVLLFPERISGEYWALHRPNPRSHFCIPEMWIARSPDGLHWGHHEPFLGASGEWETSRIGGGAPPIRTPEGWLEIYHGSHFLPDDPTIGAYTAGALLLDLDDPRRVLKRSTEPILVPEASFEREGYVPNVVFPSGIVDKGDVFQVYYGAADTCTALVELAKRDLLNALT